MYCILWNNWVCSGIPHFKYPIWIGYVKQSYKWGQQLQKYDGVHIVICVKFTFKGNVHCLFCDVKSAPFCLFVDPQQQWVGGPQRGLQVSERLQCNICGKVFQNRNSLCEHKSVHSGKTQCPVCHAVLSRIRHVRRHMVTKHGWLP